ncbi:PREDICTED: PDZ domain-containing protein 8-like [Acropora digitifera]|uniref:PDZ domain-containing protein 8-like n=1 Tax=Acropora digitifera TaxID=70779 RepID=UPI00077A5DD0|nr:PREDICTED: PDZ domain-containing protein 8-like [Acropora digitifera]
MVIALILAFLIGVFSVLLLEGIFLYKWWTSKPEDDRKLYPKRTKVTNPKFIADYIMKDGASEEESCLSLNFLLAFLWREWRDSPKTKSFLLARMNSELTELIKSKAVSKVIEQITIDELSLGTCLPIIKGTVHIQTSLYVQYRSLKEVKVTISRETNDISFGLTLKEVNDGEFGKTIVIQTIVTDSPAYCAGIVAKDIFLAIDGRKTDSLKQAAKMIKNKNRFTATVQRPPTRLTQQLNQDVPDKELGKTVVDYKNVALDSNSESEDEFVNIVVPLFEHADREMAKSVVQEMLLTSTDLRQQAEKKLKLKQGGKVPLGTANTESGVEAKPTGTGDQVRRDQRAIGLTSADEKQDSPRVLRKTSDQVTQDVDKKVVFPSSTNDSPAQGNDQVSPPSQTAVDGPDHVKTRLVPASVEPVWSETVKFDILQGHQYLNVCIWCKFQDKNEKDALLGYISIPLMDIAWQCLALSSKRHEQCYMLVSPHSDRVISNMSYLRNNPSLKDQPCCGDVTLIFRHTPSLADCDETILEKPDFLATSELKDESQLKDTLESLEPPKHQFSLTQFHFPTRCSYCNKKVWTKVAFQCRICAMICHKKCLQSCMRYTHCIHETKSTPRWFSKMPPKRGKNKTKKKKRQQQDCSSAEESIAEGSSESELDRNIKKTEKCPDKEVKKQSGANDCDQTETSNEIEVRVSTVFTEKSEERGQALAMLMLQYCSGYQSCVEAEESDRYQL